MQVLIVFVMYALFASVFSVGKLALVGAAPFFMTGIRMLAAGGVLLLWQWWRDREGLRIRLGSWPLLIGIGFFNVFITNGFEFWGLQFLPSGQTSLIYSLSPLVAIVFSFLILGERLRPLQVLGLAIGLSSIIPMMGWDREFGWKEFSLAEGAVSISACTAVIGWVLVKKITVNEGCSIVTTNGFSFLVGGMMSLLLSWFVESWNPTPLYDNSWAFWGPFAYIVIIHNILCYNLYGYSLKRFSVTFMTLAGLTNPLFAAGFGWLAFGETVGLGFFVALAQVAVGLSLYLKQESSEGAVEKSKQVDIIIN